MQVLRESFDETMETIVTEMNNRKFMDMEEETNEAWTKQMSFSYQEELVDTISLEDELANSEITYMTATDNGKIKIAGRVVEWKKTNSTIRPYLGDIEIKGKLKRKLIYALVDFKNYKEVVMHGKAFLKYNFQYGFMSIDMFTDDIKKLSGFFKIRGTANINATHFIRQIDVSRYAYQKEIDVEVMILEDEVADLTEENLTLQERIDELEGELGY